MKTILAVALLFCFISCNQAKKKEQPADARPLPPPPPINECFQYNNEGDTIILRMQRVDDNVGALLVYRFKEKDSNVGTIRGQIKGDWLIATYIFMSEGVRSVREVAFKKIGDAYYPAYGEMIDQKDKMVFKNPDSLTVDEKLKMVETACP